ncbi:MAG TPA: hypothetical protein VFA07_17970 [Chthonomonadaceae bacterium]|nr:hypothetical protein [Chthonomonadaceae bacterium]
MAKSKVPSLDAGAHSEPQIHEATLEKDGGVRKGAIIKRSKSGMKFFTPELYSAFNSSDDEEADRANGAWENAIRDYQRHLDTFRLDMPYNLRNLSDLSLHDAEILALHDAEILGLSQKATIESHSSKIRNGAAVFVLTLWREEKVINLTYLIWDHVRLLPPGSDWRFSKAHIHWLYDEFDRAGGQTDQFWHRILISDGSVIEIPVTDVLPVIAVHLHGSPWQVAHPVKQN